MKAEGNRKVAALMARAVEASDDHRNTVSVLARTLVKAMEEMHGGDFRLQIDHEAGLIVIAQRRTRRKAGVQANG